jgi:RHS repeat-associated protein
MSTSTDATVTRYDNATFYLVNPPSGTHAITATFSASPTNSCGDAISFTGVDQSHPIDATSSKTSSGETSESQAIRTNTDKAYIADSITVHVATALTASSTQQKQRDDNISANSRCAISTLGPVSPAGTSTLAWTWNGSSQPVTHVITSLKPAGGVPGPATTTVTTRYISTDYLTGSNVVTNASGTVAETLDYYPYGGLRIDAKSNYGGVRNKYAGTVYDPLSGLNYMQARYQNPNRGQFLSEDPVFLGNPKDQNLQVPQSLNVYGYANGNPITLKDPSGNYAGVDDATAFGIGGVVGTGMYVMTSKATGQPLSWGGFAGAFISGGVVGWATEYAPVTGGASTATAITAMKYASKVGAVAGVVGNGIKQSIDIGTGAQNDGVHWDELALSPVQGAVSAAIGEGAFGTASIPGLSCGRGNCAAIGQMIRTQLKNGAIENVSFSTAIKSAVGSQASGLYKTAGGAAWDTTSYTAANAIVSSMNGWANSSKKDTQQN